LEANERARARLLLETIPLSRIKVKGLPARDLDNRKRSLHREINRLAQQLQTGTLTEAETADRNQRLDSLLFDLDDVQAQILAVDPRYQRLISPSLLRVAEIQNQLDPETLLLEYRLGETRSFLWAVTTSSVAAFSNLPSRSEVDELVRSLYDSVSARSHPVTNESPTQKKARLDAAHSNYRGTASLLSEKLLGPIADRLKIPLDRFYVNLDKYGNTSAAAVAIALDEANRSGRIKHGDYVLMVVFGGGLTWASTVIEW